MADDELLEPTPAGDEAVPDAAERACRREMPVPLVLRVPEGPRVVELLPEHERIDRRDRNGERDTAKRAHAVAVSPREQRERRQQREPGRAREDREARDDAGGGEALPRSASRNAASTSSRKSDSL